MIRGGSDPGSLEGLLERGRGAGWAAAFAHPERAREIVIDCVLRDPRWDRQIESRAEYYAQLLLGLDAPLEAVVDAARAAPEDAISLARQVTEELARRGAPVPPELAHAELGEEMRADDSGIRPQPTIGPPPIATSASTRALLVSATPAKVRKLTNVLVQRTSSGDRDAVRMAARDGSVAARNAALRTLGRWKDATALAIVDDALDAIARGAVFRGLTSACTEYLVELGGDEALSRPPCPRWSAHGASRGTRSPGTGSSRRSWRSRGPITPSRSRPSGTARRASAPTPFGSRAAPSPTRVVASSPRTPGKTPRSGARPR